MAGREVSGSRFPALVRLLVEGTGIQGGDTRHLIGHAHGKATGLVVAEPARD